MTLLEALMSVLILVSGVAALFGMITNVQNANRSMALQANALDVFARISAQIRDAECDVTPGGALQPGTADPIFLAPIPGAGYQAAPVAGSAVNLIGDGATNPDLADYTPPLRVAFQVRAEAVPPGAPPSFQVDVMVRQIMRNPAQDNLAVVDGYWIRIYPVQKLCNTRVDATQRGEY